MTTFELSPFEPDAQRTLAGAWSRFVGEHQRGRIGEGMTDVGTEAQVRAVVHSSWERSRSALVSPSLEAAPMALDESGVEVARERTDWYGAAIDAIALHQRAFSGAGHIISLFDADGRMLVADGDPQALEGLAEINFRPGGKWTEGAAGTNGPGTALATGLPAHIVGREHYCERWQRWHCAAVPIRDPGTLRIAGAVDISGFWEQAHPHTISLVLALGVAIEQTLAAREMERRYLLLQAFNATAGKYALDGVVAIDRAGRIVALSPSLSSEMAETLAATVRGAPHCLPDASGGHVAIGDRRVAAWFPVRQGEIVVGGCFVVEGVALPKGSEGIPFKPGDVKVYARRFFEAGARDLGLLRVDVADEVYDAMQAYRWPGNVREMKNVVRRLLQTTNGTVRLHHLPHAIREAWSGSSDLHSSAIDAEDALLFQVVRESRTMADAAARLNITRSTLYRRMERFGLKPKRVLGRE